MIVPDANLLIYAYDSTSSHHTRARAWWEHVLGGDEPVGIPWVVILAFTRILTHPSVALSPLAPAEVRSRVEEWFHHPHVRAISPGPGGVDHFFEFLEAAGIGGSLSTDAHIAAIAKELGGRVFSNDRDFDRFPGIIRVNPLD